MKKLLSRVKQKISRTINPHKDNLQAFNKGYSEFISTGETTNEAYMAMLNLYCGTNGKFNEQKHKEIIVNNPPKKIEYPLKGALGTFENKDFNILNETLNKDGYAPLTHKISADTIKRLNEFALTTETTAAPKYDKRIIYNPEQTVSEMYRFDMQDLVRNPDIQALIMDPVLINIARNYLNCEPIFDFPAMWWSTTHLKEASSEAAQLYHFDLDRIKWLKIFIYLNDVTEENGPHRLIKGSHLPGAKPQELLKRGYARIPDEDLIGHYKKDDFIVVLGEAGSVFLEDTKCWHKGTPLKSGHRLVLEFEYTSSMFGANYPKYELKNVSDEFKTFCKNNPVYASNFRF